MRFEECSEDKKADFCVTDLWKNKKVLKYDLRIEAVGTLDEAVSALGLARVSCRNKRVLEIILILQKGLYNICSEIVTLRENYNEAPFRLTKKHTQKLGDIIHELLEEKPPRSTFIIPGDSLGSAALHLARTIVRRAERLVCRLVHDKLINNKEIIRYLNKLSELVFMLAWVEDET